jgi:5-methylcytosine-specific restriction endonuclease McrA
LPFEFFYVRRASKDGYAFTCIKCDKERKANLTPDQKQANVLKSKNWAISNPERVSANKKKSAEKNRIARNERNRARYQQNPEIYRAKSRALRNANKELYDRHGINRRAIKRGTGGIKLSASEIMQIRKSPCFYCGTIGLNELDHIVPLSRGGKHTIGNLVSACRTCNASKGNKTIMEWRLNKPRADSLRRADPRGL